MKPTTPGADGGHAQPVAIDACWRRVGVRGDHSCPELAVHVHCHHCPVHAQAAQRLLGRPLPEGQREIWAERMRDTVSANAAPSATWLLFRVGREWLALDAAHCEEIVAMRPVHTLPQRRRTGLTGIVSVRGELLPCLSLAELMGTEAASAAAGVRRLPPRLLVLRSDDGRYVCTADEVHGLLRTEPGALMPTPTTVADARPNYLRALLDWRQRSVGVIDAPLLFAALARCLE